MDLDNNLLTIMKCNDLVIAVTVVLLVAVILIMKSNTHKKVHATHHAEESYPGVEGFHRVGGQPRVRFAPQRQRLARELMEDGMPAGDMPPREMNVNDPSMGMPTGATSERREQQAALMDAREITPNDLLPNANDMNDEWKSMFSHSDNTLAQENAIEPSHEYAVGSLNMPTRFLSQDLRGQPPITHYDNLTPFNNSELFGLDLSESEIRRAGDL